MPYLDETFIAPNGQAGTTQAESARREERQKEINDQIRAGTLMLGEEIMTFKPVSMLDGRIRMMLPGHFATMPEEYVALKYPSANRPGVIYTNRNATVDLAFNHTLSPMTEAQMDPFIRSMWEVMKKAQPSARLVDQGIREIAGRKIGFLAFVTPAMDHAIYNLIHFVSLEGRALLIGFNCPEMLQERWQPIAWGMLETLEISQPVEGGITAHE